MNSRHRDALNARYRLIMLQKGEGCDYTIGCGIRVVGLKAVSFSMAMHEAKAIVIDPDNGYLNDEEGIDAAFLVTDFEDLPIDQWRNQREAEQTASKESEQDAADRAEYERLKRKYG